MATVCSTPVADATSVVSGSAGVDADAANGGAAAAAAAAPVAASAAAGGSAGAGAGAGGAPRRASRATGEGGGLLSRMRELEALGLRFSQRRLRDLTVKGEGGLGQAGGGYERGG